MPTIRVVVRFRPINSSEKQTALDNKWSGKQICPLYVDEKHLLSFGGDDVSEDDKLGKQVRCAPPKVHIAHQPKFAFDEILIWVNQSTAFLRIGLPVVIDALDGVNGTIFAYGQTGSGKTFSMFGPEILTDENAKLLGIIPRCCAQIFTTLDTDNTIKAYRIDVSFFEIYIRHQIRDLLHPAKKGDPPLKVRDGPKGVFIEHLKSETATNLVEILSLIALANSHRTVSYTKMNATSSRSHCMMRVGIRIERRDGSRVKSQITFGDLAGSEKVDKTGHNLREAQAINQSLTMLGNVISALANIGSGKKKADSLVPFRDSALTHVLKDSLSGNCKTTLVATAIPHKFNLVETISTFRFASRCKLVKTKAEKNVVLSSAQMRQMIESLKVEIKSLKMQLLQGGGGGGSALGGIGVKITWPSDYGAWTTDKKTYGVLRKQVNAQIKEVLQTSVAANSDEVASMPYAISLSPAGSKRKVTIQFRCDDDYDRETCIELSKKLAQQIDKINKNSLSPALKAYKEVRAFSEAGVGELKELIEKQKTQITLLGEQVSAAQQEVMDKNEEIDNLQQSVSNLDNVSVRNKSEFMMGAAQPRDHNPTGGVSMVNIPDLFGKKSSNIRASSIFEGSTVASNSLRVRDLLSQLLHSKYEVLRSKRALQLLQVRHASEQEHRSQFRSVISRMQSELMDLKAKTSVSRAVFTGMTEQIAENEDGTANVKLPNQIFHDNKQAKQFGAEDGFNEFIEGALDDILNDDDGKDDVKQVDVVDIPSVAFDDEERLWRGYDKEWIAKWRVDDVCQWLKKIYGGRMRKYIKHFRKQKIDGKRLLDLQMPDYLDLRLLRVDALQILAFTNSIIDPLSDEEDDDFDDFFADLNAFFDDDDVDDIVDVEEDVVFERADPRFYDNPTLRLTDAQIEGKYFKQQRLALMARDPDKEHDLTPTSSLLRRLSATKPDPLTDAASLQQFSCADVAYKIEEWIVNDHKYSLNLLKTKQILSKHLQSGKQMSVLSPENIKQIIKDDMLQFMSHDTLRIMFECFAELKNHLNLKQKTADDIGELLFHFPINKLLNTIRQKGIDGKYFIRKGIDDNIIEEATGWSLTEVSQIESVLLHHYTLSKLEFAKYVRDKLTNEQDADYTAQSTQTLPNHVTQKIEDIILSFDVEELQFKIQNGLSIDAFSDRIINMVHDCVSDENDNEMVQTIYDAVSECFMFNYDWKYHPRWICYNCSNRNLITYIDNHMDTDLSICSLCGIQRKESVLLRIRNHPTFMDVLDEHKHNNNDHPHDMDDLESTIVTTANNESISLTCPNRNDNKNCTSMINLCKRLIQYNRWINTVSDKLNGKDNIENTIDVDIQKYLDDDVFQTVFMNSIRSLQRLNTHDANLLIQMSHDICMTAFFEMSRIQFARYVSEQTNTKIGLGLRLYSKIMKSAKQKAHTRAFGVFLSDIHMDVVDRDYHHILNVHIHKGTKDTIKNAFRFFNTLVHYSDTDDVIKQCRSVHRRGNRVRQLHSLEKREDEDISLDTNIWKLKQFYNQTQLDMIHTFLVHNTWQSVMQRFIPSQHVDDDNDEYHLDESKHKEIDLQNKGKYITGAGDLSKTKQNHYGFGVDHSHPHLSPIHDSIRDELAFNKMFPLTESQFQNLLIKAIKLHQIAIETEYRRDLICKYYNKHYNIIRNEPIGLRHVFAIIAYTDLSKFCTAYRSTYRLIDDEKTAFEVTQRHRQLYYYSRALFEAIEFFGSLMESGLSVYHGLNKVMFFESFRTFFNQPISTTLNMSTAIQFSGGIGTILTLKSGAINMNDPSKVPKYLPVSWLSCFPNEDEKLFYGAYVNFKIKNIIEAQKMKGHKKELKLLHKFEDTIKNKCVIWNAKNKKDKQRLQTLILLIKEQTCDPSVITPYGKKLFEYFCANSNSVCIQSFELLPIELRNALFGEQISLDPILRLFPNLKDITLNKLNIDQMTRDAKTYADVVLKHINKAQLQKLERIVFKSIKQGGGKQNSRLKKLADKYAQQYSKCNWKIQYKLTKLDIENTHDLSFINHNTSKQTEKKERMETAAKRNSIVVINKSQIYDHIPFHFMQVRSVNIDEFMVEISVDTLSNQKRKLFIKEIGTDDSDVVVPVRIPKRKTSCLRSIYVDCDEKHGEEYNLGLFENKQAQDPIENCTPIQVVMPKDIKQLPPYNEAYKPNPIDSAQVFASSDETSKQMNIYWATPSETYGDISYKVTYKTIQGDSSVEIVSSLPYSIVVSLLPVSFEVVTLCTVHETVYKSDPSEMINVSGFTKTK